MISHKLMNNVGHFFFLPSGKQSLLNTQENNLDQELWLLKSYQKEESTLNMQCCCENTGQNPNFRYMGVVFN